jgi:hypothetical protein
MLPSEWLTRGDSSMGEAATVCTRGEYQADVEKWTIQGSMPEGTDWRSRRISGPLKSGRMKPGTPSTNGQRRDDAGTVVVKQTGSSRTPLHTPTIWLTIQPESDRRSTRKDAHMKKTDIWISIGIIAAALVTFYFYTQRKGYITVDAGGATASLLLRSGWLSEAYIGSDSGPVLVPARHSRPQRLRIIKKENGGTWQLETTGPWGNLAQVKVKNRRTTILRVGPPLLIKPTVQRSGSSVSIGLSIIGRAGEQYGVQRITKDGRQYPPASAVKIVDESGKILAAGKFAYG